MNYKESLEKLFSLHQFGIKLGLENIKNLLSHIGNPERGLQTIHIAGSNGKGSTASFIASILMEAGFRVGLYTSPHFIRFNERIRINGVEIPDDFIAKFINQNTYYIDEESPTFFEITTALAFKYFKDKKVDYAVIETGLGGRLDATNVLQSLASVITTVSLEHTNILGNTVSSITKEKAAIIKENQKVFIGALPEAAKKIIIAKANELNSECFELEKSVSICNDKGIVKYGNSEIVISHLPLLGEYQINNSALAVLTIINLFPEIKIGNLLTGLKNVIVNSGIQGRYECYNHSPKVIFDSAHNSEGVDLFLKEFKKEKPNYSKCSLIYGAMRDKNVEGIIQKLDEHFDVIYGTEIDYERSLKISEIIDIGKKYQIKILSLKSPAKFILNFINSDSREVLVILGSMYILGEIKKELQIDIT